MPFESLYDVLGISSTAAQDEIKDAYRRQAMKWHPDRNPLNKQAAEELFKQIAYAYKVLSDPASRVEYDRWLTEQRQGVSAGAGANEHQNQNAGVSEDDAEQMFFEQMLDLAEELASRGFSAEKIVKTLVALDCPEAIAKAVAANAVKMTNQRPGSGKRQTRNQQDGAGIPHSLQSMSWDDAAPYYAAVYSEVEESSRMSDIEFAKKLTTTRIQLGILLLLSIVGQIILTRITDFNFVQHPSESAAYGMTILFSLCFFIWWRITDTRAFRVERAFRYYTKVFRNYHEPAARLSFMERWNFWAGFCWTYWLVYRRMAGYAFLGLIPLGIIAFFTAVLAGSSMALNTAISWCLIAVLGAVANRIYVSAAIKRIAQFSHLPKQQALEEIHKASKPRRGTWVWVTIPLLIAYVPATFFQIEANQQKIAALNEQQLIQEEARRNAAAEAQAKSEAETSARAQTEEQVAERKSFDIAIREMELRHPEFEPNHPRYSQKLVDEVIARMNGYVRQGNSRPNALKLAVSDMEREADAARAIQR